MSRKEEGMVLLLNLSPARSDPFWGHVLLTREYTDFVNYNVPVYQLLFLYDHWARVRR